MCALFVINVFYHLTPVQAGNTMKAVRFVGAGCPAQVVDIPTPIPGPGEILVKIGGFLPHECVDIFFPQQY